MMSSSQRFTGLPGRRLAVYLGSTVGSHSRDVVVHLGALSAATLPAHRHFRRLCSVTQSSVFNAVICASASRVLLFIQSIHDSVASSLSTVVVLVGWSWLFSGGLLSTS